MEKFFKVAERGSNPAQEFRAGITTFLAMAYIIAVNPALLLLQEFQFRQLLLLPVLVAAS